ncbi:MAG: response regulator [Lachnospiraceae bacterium]|nr:response regulator [Lachnospiraceae bacterium]
MFKVIVIDDEALVRKGIVLETNWNELGCMVVAEAGNGIEGIEAVHKYQPDLLICDIKMPKMDGIEMLRRLREEENDVSVIFLTAYGEFEYAQNALKLLASDYLLKPFQDGELEETVLRVTKKIAKRQGRKTPQSEEIAGLVLPSGGKSKYVMEALAFIGEHYNDTDMSVGMIAESLGISEGHLSHTFKKETDYTVMAYITRYRMRAAMRLLGDCRNKVYEVAESVGYRDIAYFSSTFKKIVGVSPSEYQDRSI